ncbi:DUF2663 family protein [Mycoplasmopsis ciconiae]|uniref:DUF2663 family protein n=1 Tax=Mycoplasmopsis ciconiae TaxID=561067 RepID=A0ABU7MM86_9BACT|nr:DUF2663 family protein [Mycoplasmopsis ciconiae]
MEQKLAPDKSNEYKEDENYVDKINQKNDYINSLKEQMNEKHQEYAQFSKSFLTYQAVSFFCLILIIVTIVALVLSTKNSIPGAITPVWVIVLIISFAVFIFTGKNTYYYQKQRAIAKKDFESLKDELEKIAQN